MNSLKINQYKIDENSPVFIIAEAGVNHNGSLNMAKRLVIEAKNCGADCVKFQTFKAERVVNEDSPKALYQNKTTDPNESQLEMLRNCELKDNYHKKLLELCEKVGIIFLSTPYNVEDVDFLDQLGVQAYKLASIHAVEPYFINYTAKKGKPIILSTGMATLSEINDAVKSIRNASNKNFSLLQCTTNYPSRYEDANLNAMITMKNKFNVVVGYSDHTKDDTVAIVSVGLGAKIIEKHFTLDKTLPGPDHTSSLNPEEFKQFVEKIRNAEKTMGTYEKFPCEIEKENLKGMRRSIVAKIDINNGTIITPEMITFKRPANGIEPRLLNKIIGKKVITDITKDSFIRFKMLK